jgi:hypothetical protein
MYSTARLLTMAAMGAMLAACTHRSPDTTAVPENAAPGTIAKMSGESDSTRATLHVRNDMFNDCDIFAYKQGQRYRLGLVTGTSSADIVLPKYLIQPGAELVFIAHPIGGRTFTSSGRVYVDPGDIVDFWIPAHG